MYGRSIAVAPQMPRGGPAPATNTSRYQHRRSHWRFYLLCGYNGSVWALLTLLLFAQVLAIVWNSVTYRQHVVFGQPTSAGMYALSGFNDELYADRGVVCVFSDHALRPMQLSAALEQQQQSLTRGIDGIRVVMRDVDSFVSIEDSTRTQYERKCELLAMTLETIFDACDALGYNVTRDALRVTPGLAADGLVTVDKALAVIFFPFWDHGLAGRYVVPGEDGCACVLRTFGGFQSETATYAQFAGTPRAAHDAKIDAWIPGSQWQNGWRVDRTTGAKWFVHVASSVLSDQSEMPLVRFDLLENAGVLHIVNCSLETCAAESVDVVWGDQLQFRVGFDWFRSVFVSNGARFGLFSHESVDVLTVTSSYRLDQLISNVTLATLLLRWLVAMLALAKTRETIGVAALANSRSFCLLPLLLLPRLKTSLEGFWTAGCQFEGDQKALSEAWFVMYPAIGEVVLAYFSVLHLLAKLLRRRMSDALFGPTLLFFGLLHYCRFELAASKWLGYDGRISTVVTATEVHAASIFTFVLSDFAWRINGQVTSLFAAKLVVIALNLVPLLVGSRDVRKRNASEPARCGVETALAMRFGWNGGLGQSPIYDTKPGTPTAVLPYELVRGGYVMMSCEPASQAEEPSSGSEAPADTAFLVLTIDHWLWFVFLTPRHLGRWWRALLVFRVVVFEAISIGSPVKGGVPTLKMRDLHPLPCRVCDAQFENVRPWQIAACAVT